MRDKERKAAENQGFKNPFESDPVDSPPQWEYRGLMNMGGYVMCRVWRHKRKNQEVIYNLKNGKVTLIDGKYDEDKEEYVGDPDDVIVTRERDREVTDKSLQQIARELMRDYT